MLKTECCGVFQNGCFSSLSLLEVGGDFSDIHCENLGLAPGGQSKKKCDRPLLTGFPGVFDSQTFLH